MIKLTQNTEVFENEEAAKFLDYFVAYRKLMNIATNAKKMAAANSEISLSKKEPTLTNSLTNEINDSHPTIAISTALDK